MKQKQYILENLIYAFIWLVMFIIPLAGYSFEGTIHWDEVGKYWERLLPFVLLFLLNNYLLIPRLLFRRRHLLYSGLLLLSILLLFIARPLITDSPYPGPHPKKEQLSRENNGDYSREEKRPDQGETISPYEGKTSPHEERIKPSPFMDPPPRDRKKGPPLMLFPKKWGPYLNGLLMAMLVAGFNIAIRLLFKSMNDAKQLDELERRNLRNELNYLKAQINPHFFMNTLNNIHALIDIDGKKAKRTVVELSKLMRYVLYEAEKSFITLEKEIEFIENYIALMRIRYTEDVEITSVYPQDMLHARIPPLLLITLIENAFKHGINISGKSCIHSRMTIEDEHLFYSVANTLPTDPPDSASVRGMGLDNLRKRLELLFGEDNYGLEIYSGDGVFMANLHIPVKT
ncbi:histidine kinase [Proteiniphilum sp. X52]|nr:histidine kinase [Proteiniphilum sp. X52]